MSKTIACPKCGDSMDVPAYEGDGVYTRHECRETGYTTPQSRQDARRRTNDLDE